MSRGKKLAIFAVAFVLCVGFTLIVFGIIMRPTFSKGTLDTSDTTPWGWVQLMIGIIGSLGLGGGTAWEGWKLTVENMARQAFSKASPNGIATSNPSTQEVVKNFVDVATVMTMIKVQNSMPKGSESRAAVTLAGRKMCEQLTNQWFPIETQVAP